MNTLTELIARHTRAAKDALAHYGSGCVLSIDARELLALCEAAERRKFTWHDAIKQAEATREKIEKEIDDARLLEALERDDAE